MSESSVILIGYDLFEQKWTNILLFWVRTCITPAKDVNDLNVHTILDIINRYKPDVDDYAILKEEFTPEDLQLYILYLYPKLDLSQYDRNKDPKKFYILATVLLFHSCICSKTGQVHHDIRQLMTKEDFFCILRFCKTLVNIDVNIYNIELAIKVACESKLPTHSRILMDSQETLVYTSRSAVKTSESKPKAPSDHPQSSGKTELKSKKSSHRSQSPVKKKDSKTRISSNRSKSSVKQTDSKTRSSSNHSRSAKQTDSKLKPSSRRSQSSVKETDSKTKSSRHSRSPIKKSDSKTKSSRSSKSSLQRSGSKTKSSRRSRSALKVADPHRSDHPLEKKASHSPVRLQDPKTHTQNYPKDPAVRLFDPRTDSAYPDISAPKLGTGIVVNNPGTADPNLPGGWPYLCMLGCECIRCRARVPSLPPCSVTQYTGDCRGEMLEDADTTCREDLHDIRRLKSQLTPEDLELYIATLYPKLMLGRYEKDIPMKFYILTSVLLFHSCMKSKNEHVGTDIFQYMTKSDQFTLSKFCKTLVGMDMTVTNVEMAIQVACESRYNVRSDLIFLHHPGNITTSKIGETNVPKVLKMSQSMPNTCVNPAGHPCLPGCGLPVNLPGVKICMRGCNCDRCKLVEPACILTKFTSDCRGDYWAPAPGSGKACCCCKCSTCCICISIILLLLLIAILLCNMFSPHFKKMAQANATTQAPARKVFTLPNYDDIILP